VSRTPSQKGTSFLPVIVALKQHPDRKKIVPESLWKYFDEPILVSGWYPERDYWVLLSALVSTIEPADVGGDVWRYFAQFSAKRDIGGDKTIAVSTDNKSATGIYRSYGVVDKSEFDGLFRRSVRLWSRYHDTGTMEIAGGRPSTNTVVMRLTGFSIPIEGFIRLTGYYMEEYARLVGIEATCTVTRSTANRDPYCEWEFRLGRSPEAEAYVASLPPLR
jgi:hypothetical protein